MLAFISLALLINAALAAALAVTPRSIKGSIEKPLPGTAIAPSTKFDFQYLPLADYGVSTFYYHVWLLDVASLDGTAYLAQPFSSLFSSGYYFGRFDYPNYPGMPSRCSRFSFR